jgi:hypothetical protein
VVALIYNWVMLSGDRLLLTLSGRPLLGHSGGKTTPQVMSRGKPQG